MRIYLSIPSWSDFNAEDVQAVVRELELSIPSWSDFNWEPKRHSEAMYRAFNPILV